MITKIGITDFRSISNAEIPIKKITVLYGANGSGKSSVAYAPYVMRNFFMNPNQKLNNLFNLGFINLGSFSNVVNQKTNILSCIDLIVTSKMQLFNDKNDDEIEYTLFLFGDNSGAVQFKVGGVTEKMEIQFPFSLDQQKEFEIDDKTMVWNGLTFNWLNKKDNQDAPYHPYQLNTIYEDLKKIEVISVKRGFFSPIFSTELGNDESVLAMQIRDEGLDFELKIDKYFHQIFKKHFRFVAVPGSSSFYLKTHDDNGVTVDLVNEGFGVNQAVYILIKLLKQSTSLAFIEEPEIHLHPTAQSNLVDAFVEIVNKERKQIFLTTHSENIVSSILSKIAKAEIDKEDVQFLLAVNENGETKIIPQEINEKGQVEGGLMNFMETELSNLKAMLGV